jgi:hypothetical protein
MLSFNMCGCAPCVWVGVRRGVAARPRNWQASNAIEQSNIYTDMILALNDMSAARIAVNAFNARFASSQFLRAILVYVGCCIGFSLESIEHVISSPVFF